MPNLNELTALAAFDLPLEEAVDFLTKKIATFSWSWDELTAAAHQQAFTVAKVLQADVLESIRGALEAAQAKGTPFEAFKKELEPILRAKGWWGEQELEHPISGKPVKVQLGSPWRLETIYRTNLQSAFQAGRFKQQQALVSRRPFFQYQAVTDTRTTGVCRALHGKVFAASDPIWARAYPPNHFNCRARVVSLSERELKREGLIPEGGGGFKDWQPEKGFSGSPAAAWEPDVAKYSPGIRKQLKAAISEGAGEMPITAHENLGKLQNYLNSTDAEREIEMMLGGYMETLEGEALDSLESAIDYWMGVDATALPAWAHLRVVSRETATIVHVTKPAQADKIIAEGFQGISDMRKVATSTTHRKQPLSREGFCFGYTVPDIVSGAAKEIDWFGDIAVVFESEALRVVSEFDGDEQMIFIGSDARKIRTMPVQNVIDYASNQRKP